MSSVFVVLKAGWEYNDEYYHRPESEGGSPDCAFTSREEADKFCKEQNRMAFRGLNLCEYGGSISESHIKEINNMIASHYSSCSGLPDGISIEDLKKLEEKGMIEIKSLNKNLIQSKERWTQIIPADLDDQILDLIIEYLSKNRRILFYEVKEVGVK